MYFEKSVFEFFSSRIVRKIFCFVTVTKIKCIIPLTSELIQYHFTVENIKFYSHLICIEFTAYDKTKKASQYWPASETPFAWHFADGHLICIEFTAYDKTKKAATIGLPVKHHLNGILLMGR